MFQPLMFGTFSFSAWNNKGKFNKILHVVNLLCDAPFSFIGHKYKDVTSL